MDKILSAILAANEPNTVKVQVYQKIKDASSSPQPPEVVTQILTISSNMALDSDARSQVGFEIFTSWANNNPKLLDQFLTTSFVHRLVDGRAEYSTTGIKLLHSCFRILSNNEVDVEQYATIVRNNVINFIRETNKVDTLDVLMKFLIVYKVCVPTSEFWPAMCLALIKSISRLPLPSNEANLVDFIKSVGLFAKFTSQLWQNQNSTLNRALSLILEIISSKAGDQEPSVALAAVIQLVPTEIIPEAVRSVLSDRTLEDQNLSAALHRLVNWLGWITATNLPAWILAFLRALAAEKKYSILILATLSKVQVVFDCLRFQQLRANTLPVLKLMLLSFQHSPQAFHKVAEALPSTIQLLREENTPESLNVVLELNELARTLMNHFSGFPDLYDPIIEALKDFEEPPAEKMKSLLSENKWSAQSTATHSVLQLPKSETGKVGLDNLGNSCYVNSVIQALYMCDELRCMVFSSPAYSLHSLPGKLQQLFAFLRLSERASYCPRDFVTASRPSWFMAGQQNDCSEYLKFLLDELNEAEKGNRKITIGSAASAIAAAMSSTAMASTMTPPTIDGNLSAPMQVMDDEDDWTGLPNPNVKASHGSTSIATVKTESDSAEAMQTDDDEAMMAEAIALSTGSTTSATSEKMSVGSDATLVGDSSASSSSTVKEMDSASSSATFAEPIEKDSVSSCATQTTLSSDSFSDSAIDENASARVPPHPIAPGNKDTSIDYLFMGKCQTTVTCLECGFQSCRNENFFDLPLAFPDSNIRTRTEDTPTLVGGDSSAACANISSVQDLAHGDSIPLEKLIHYYLQPEILKDENQYHCTQCDKLRDAEKTVCITRAPRYLLLTLLRFSYDTKTQSRTKLLTDVNYPLSLMLATNQKPKAQKRKRDGQCESEEAESTIQTFPYQLNSVIVHSGQSSDCGHYYTYARHLNQSEASSHRWFQFNDDRVTYASYDSFTSLNRRFRLDTPYVLVYCMSGNNLGPDPDMDPILVSAVERDNAAYRNDLERSKKKVRFNLGPRGPGDQNDPPGGCGIGGFPGLNVGPRFGI